MLMSTHGMRYSLMSLSRQGKVRTPKTKPSMLASVRDLNHSLVVLSMLH